MRHFFHFVLSVFWVMQVRYDAQERPYWYTIIWPYETKEAAVGRVLEEIKVWDGSPGHGQYVIYEESSPTYLGVPLWAPPSFEARKF